MDIFIKWKLIDKYTSSYMKKYIIITIGIVLVIGSVTMIFISLPDGKSLFGVKQIFCLATLLLGAYLVVWEAKVKV